MIASVAYLGLAVITVVVGDSECFSEGFTYPHGNAQLKMFLRLSHGILKELLCFFIFQTSLVDRCLGKLWKTFLLRPPCLTGFRVFLFKVDFPISSSYLKPHFFSSLYTFIFPLLLTLFFSF